MSGSIPIFLARVFLKMHLRDRQAIILSLFFPIAFMLALGLSGGTGDPIALGVVNDSQSALAREFIATLNENPLLDFT